MNLINELNSVEKNELRGLILSEVKNNEKEYCFDKSYTSDSDWILYHGKETRHEAYSKAVTWHNSLSLEEILKEYDGVFDYIVGKYIDEKNKDVIEMEKVYVLISRYESSDEVFTTVHKTFKGAVDSLNEDYRESRGFDGDIYRFEDSDANQSLYYNVGGICYEILESKVYE